MAPMGCAEMDTLASGWLGWVLAPLKLTEASHSTLTFTLVLKLGGQQWNELVFNEEIFRPLLFVC
jgi:hypothetical protein